MPPLAPLSANARIPALLGLAALSAAAVAKLALLERDRRLLPADRAATDAVARPLARFERQAAALHPLGKDYAYIPAAAAAGFAVLALGRGRPAERAAGGAAVLLAALAAAAVNPLFDKLLPQPPEPPPGRADNPKPTFPSGHAFGVGAVTFAAAYVGHREQILPAAVAAPLALLPPVISGGAKLVERKHWPSEVAAGLLVAAAIAASAAVVYELAPTSRHLRRP